MPKTIRSALIEVAWLVFTSYWAISAFRTARAQSKESLAWRYVIAFGVLLGVIVLASRDTGNVFLGNRIFPRTYALDVIGVALTWAGIGLAIWARWHLGEYWSGRVRLRDDHKLIRTGPYARLRHPIYSGLDLAAIGTALAIDRWQCVGMVCVFIFGFAMKAKREEAVLNSRFGEGFQEHKRQTGFLLPRF